MDDPDDLARARRTRRAATVARRAASQAGLVARRQLVEFGMSADLVRNQLRAGRWAERSPTVLSTFTGELTREQTMWLGVLHAGRTALVGGLSAGEVHGLHNWHRDDITILVPYDLDLEDLPGIRFVRTRRDLPAMATRRGGLPLCRLEPAVLLFAAYQPSPRTAQGVLAASVQQRLTTPDDLSAWLIKLRPLRRAPAMRSALVDIAGGSQSVAEIDMVRLCRRMGLAKPDRQRKRRDANGRVRWTDCEWRLPDGHVLILEVDGSFHMDVESWEDDLARQRRISHPGRTVVRCTARELRDEPETIGQDLLALGVPPRDAQGAG